MILVQVLKDERGFKGAALSTFISIAGKYIVLMPNTPKGGGISRKIFNSGERKKIRSILNEITIPKEMGLIVRTAGSNKTKNEISHDLETLVKSSVLELPESLEGCKSGAVGLAGDCVSMVIPMTEELLLTLPAASVALTTMG